MGAAFRGADVVGKGMNVFLVTRVVLQGEIHRYALGQPLSGNDGVDARIAGIEVLHELLKAALGMVSVGFIAALVHAYDLKTSVQIGQFFEAFLQDGKRKLGGFKNLLVGEKAHRGAVAVCLAQVHEFGDRHPALVALTPAPPILAHGYFQPFGQGVDARHAHAVQTARHLISGVVELPSGVQLGHDHLHGGHALFGMDVYGNAAAVVAHRHAVVEMQRDLDAVAVTGHGFVDGVVHHFIHQVVQSTRVGTADIHGRAFTHGGQPLQHSDRGGVVSGLGSAGYHPFLRHE